MRRGCVQPHVGVFVSWGVGHRSKGAINVADWAQRVADEPGGCCDMHAAWHQQQPPEVVGHPDLHAVLFSPLD